MGRLGGSFEECIDIYVSTLEDNLSFLEERALVLIIHIFSAV